MCLLSTLALGWVGPNLDPTGSSPPRPTRGTYTKTKARRFVHPLSESRRSHLSSHSTSTTTQARHHQQQHPSPAVVPRSRGSSGGARSALTACVRRPVRPLPASCAACTVCSYIHIICKVHAAQRSRGYPVLCCAVVQCSSALLLDWPRGPERPGLVSLPSFHIHSANLPPRRDASQSISRPPGRCVSEKACAAHPPAHRSWDGRWTGFVLVSRGGREACSPVRV